MRLSLLHLPLLSAAIAAGVASPAKSAVSEAQRSAPLISSAWSPTALSSTLDLAGSLARSTAAYTLRKDYGNPDQADIWVVGVKGAGRNGGFVAATEGKGNARRALDLTEVASDDETTYYQLSLNPPHSSDITYVTLSVDLPHAARPEPPSMPQTADSIFMLFEGDLLAPLTGLSADQRSKVTDLKVRIKTPTPRIVSARAPEGFVLHQQPGSATLTFTLKGDVATLPPQVARVHYQQPEAVASIRSLDRVVELSHWGANLAIQDTMDLYNAGPKLMGQFARIEYQKAAMHRRQHTTAVSSLTLQLPPATHNPYFYDVVGNVSTSRFRSSSLSAAQSNKAVLPSHKKRREPAVLELQPRYPLLGGWNYSFTIGYDLPLGEYVKMRKESAAGRKGQYVAAVPFLTPVKDVAVDHVRVEVRLPEGARDIAVHAPFPLTSLSFPTTASPAHEDNNIAWTYLDSTGRPTVVMTKRACSDRHGQDVLIEYTLPILNDAFQKPLACASVLFALFMAIVVAKRVSCSIQTPKRLSAASLAAVPRKKEAVKA